MWQDTVIAFCQAFFIVAMMPTVFGKHKPAFSSSLMNVIIVAVISFCFFTLKLWFSVITALALGLIWLILAVQTYHSINKHRK